MNSRKKLGRARKAHNKNKKRVTYWQFSLTSKPRKVTRYESENKVSLFAYIIILTLSLCLASFSGMVGVVRAEELVSPYVSHEFNTGRSISVEEYGCVRFGVCEDSQITEKQEILSYIVEVFGDDSADIITMVRKCENSTFEMHRDNHNSNGTLDKGVLQINSVHLSGKEFPICKSAHDDWKLNIDCGKAIFDKYGLSAWSCSYVVGVTPFYER